MPGRFFHLNRPVPQKSAFLSPPRRNFSFQLDLQDKPDYDGASHSLMFPSPSGIMKRPHEPEKNHPCGYGCLLRIHRTAGPSRIPRQAHRRRQAGNARRGGGGQLRGAPFRSAFRHAFHEGSQALPPSDFHPQPHGCVQGRLRADTRHFPPLHRSGGTPFPG